MHSLSNTTSLKLQTEWRMSYELKAANCTPRYLYQKKVIIVRLELMTFTLQHDSPPMRLRWRTQDFMLQHDALPHQKKTKRSSLCEARTHDLHVIAQHSTTRGGLGAKGNKLFTSHKRTSWGHDYVELAQAHPNYIRPKKFQWILLCPTDLRISLQ